MQSGRKTNRARRITLVGLAIVGAALIAHLAAGAFGDPTRIGAPLSFAPFEHFPEPGRSPAIALLLLFALLVTLLLLVAGSSVERRFASWGASLIAIGGSINLSEEALRGSVRNYFVVIHPELGRGLAFNVADVALLIGFLSLALLPAIAIRDALRALRGVAGDEGA